MKKESKMLIILTGLIVGASAMSLFGKEFSVRGGSSPLTRFVLSFFVMIGALMFLGCPLRMVLRIAGGDMNAVVGLVGFVAGIGIGIFFLKKGFTLKKSMPLGKLEGAVTPIFSVVLLVLLVGFPAVLAFSAEGPGSMHAPIIAVIGMIAGAAFAHNFALASSPLGPTPAGKIAVIIGFIVVAVIGSANIKKAKVA